MVGIAEYEELQRSEGGAVVDFLDSKIYGIWFSECSRVLNCVHDISVIFCDTALNLLVIVGTKCFEIKYSVI